MKQAIAILAITLTSCSVFKKQPTCYCIVVDEVKYTKYNKAIIKPKSDRNVPWFRYPNVNIHKGDTVEVCMRDRVEPRF
jgi:hypothetical protein